MGVEEVVERVLKEDHLVVAKEVPQEWVEEVEEVLEVEVGVVLVVGMNSSMERAQNLNRLPPQKCHLVYYLRLSHPGELGQVEVSQNVYL